MDFSKYINDDSFMKNEVIVFIMYIEFYFFVFVCFYLCVGLLNVFILFLNRDKLVFKVVIF